MILLTDGEFVQNAQRPWWSPFVGTENQGSAAYGGNNHVLLGLWAIPYKISYPRQNRIEPGALIAIGENVNGISVIISVTPHGVLSYKINDSGALRIVENKEGDRLTIFPDKFKINRSIGSSFEFGLAVDMKTTIMCANLNKFGVVTGDNLVVININSKTLSRFHPDSQLLLNGEVINPNIGKYFLSEDNGITPSVDCIKRPTGETYLMIGNPIPKTLGHGVSAFIALQTTPQRYVVGYESGRATINKLEDGKFYIRHVQVSNKPINQLMHFGDYVLCTVGNRTMKIMNSTTLTILDTFKFPDTIINMGRLGRFLVVRMNESAIVMLPSH